MKKFVLSIVLVFVLALLILIGCSKKEESPAAPSTNAPPAATAIATFVPGIDPYEPDDNTTDAKSINLGEYMWHSLTPSGDVDYVKFDVIAGNRYLIKAQNTGNPTLETQLEFSYDENDYNYWCYYYGGSYPGYTYEIYYATFTAQVFLYVKLNNGSYGDDATYTLHITQMPVLNTVPLADAIDNTGLSISTGGSAQWFGQTEISTVGGSAAQSGHINNSQMSYMAVTVTGACTVSFKWKVSSEACCDGLDFYVDGNIEHSYYAVEGDWQQISHNITTSGNHVLSWVYSRDTSDNWGYDAGWVDDLKITP